MTTQCDPERPGLKDLIEEFGRCAPVTGGWDRALDNERTRFAIWPNQSADGVKVSTEDYEAKPWERASDLRVFLADDVITEEVAVCTSAWRRSIIRTQGVQPDDAGAAAVITRLLDWLIKGRMGTRVAREAELSAQYLLTYGWTGLHVTWTRQIAARDVDVTLEHLADAGGSALVDLVRDAGQEDLAVESIRQVWDAAVASRVRDALVGELPSLPDSYFRRAVRELRKTGETTMRVPYVLRAEPCIEALRPWVDVFVPDEIGDVQLGRCYVRHWFREEQLRSKVVTDGWDEDWVEAACKTKGMETVWASPAEGLHTGVSASVKTDELSPWIEVVTCYGWRVDELGIPAIYATVFSPHASKKVEGVGEDLVAQHGVLDFQHGEVPIVIGVREWVCRSITASRGVPEIASPEQRIVKVMSDSLIDRTTLTTLPPRLVPARLMDEDQEFGPASTVPVLRGEEPKFMPVPANDGVAQGVLAWSRDQVDQRFGLFSATVPPARAAVRQQHMVDNFLGMWTGALKQVLALLMQYMPADQFQRITGIPKPQLSPDEIAHSYDLMLNMDVRELDVDYALKQLQAVSQFVLPEDRAGVVDTAKLVQAKLAAINPNLAKELVSDRAGAQQKLFRDVQAEIASMFLGNPPSMVENDPTAPMQLQFAAQIISNNPNYQAALQKGGRFPQLLEAWGKNRMQSKVQQENKQVGRLGVQPVEGSV